jgi:hypothetical protein
MMNFRDSVAAPFDPLHTNIGHTRARLPFASHPSQLHSRGVFLWRDVEICLFTLVSR